MKLKLLLIFLFLFLFPIKANAQVASPSAQPTYPPAAIGVVWPDGTIVLVCDLNSDGSYTSKLLPNETGSSGYVGASTEPGAIVYTQPGSTCPSAPTPTLIITPTSVVQIATGGGDITPTNALPKEASKVGVIPTDKPIIPTNVVVYPPASSSAYFAPKVIMQPFHSDLIAMILAQVKIVLKGGKYDRK